MLETNSAQFQSCSFTIPLGTSAHDFARQCSHAVCHTDKVELVYLNSLAVYAVNFYLKVLGMKTDLKQSNSQDKLMLQFFPEADLLVSNIGRFECIPVEENAYWSEILLDVSFERIGYIFVKLNASRREAVILGFTKTHKAKVDLNQLQSVNDLIDYLTDLEEEVAAKNLP